MLLDVRVDWEVFNEDTDSAHLVDLVVTYGKPFPLRDATGCEIVPASERKTWMTFNHINKRLI